MNRLSSDGEQSGNESQDSQEDECRNECSEDEEIPLQNPSIECTTNISPKSNKHYIYYLTGAVLLTALFTLFQQKEIEINTKINVAELQQKYGPQEEDFWLSFQVLINETIQQNQPKSLLLLYREDSSVESFLSDISSYAVCQISECSSIPVILEGNDFQKKEASYDYGNIITQNKKQLEKSGVMVVKNTERISGKMAQAFHSLCDEFQPVVPKALFLFSVKIDKHPSDKTKHAEKLLRTKWNDLNDDLFYPLFTRISTLIFVLKTER